jgi:hypothetical protein
MLITSLHVGGTCDAIRRPNLPFRCVLISIIMLFSRLHGTWQWMMDGMSLMIVSFFVLPFFSLFPKKAQVCLFFFDLSILVFMFFIAYFHP